MNNGNPTAEDFLALNQARTQGKAKVALSFSSPSSVFLLSRRS